MVPRNSIKKNAPLPRDLRQEVGPRFQLPRYPAGMPERFLPAWQVGSDLKTRGFSEPAGNCVVVTRATEYQGTRNGVPGYSWVVGYPRVSDIPGS